MKEFEILESQAKDLFKAFPELEFKTIAALTLIIGWLLTSGEVKGFIAANPKLCVIGSMVFFGLFAIAQVIFLAGHYRKLTSVVSRLDVLSKDAGYSSTVVDTYRVGIILPVSYAIVNIFLCIAVVVLVNRISTVV